MQKIVIFIEPNKNAFITSEKIANLYMNRFFIDEDASNELLGIKVLGKSSLKFESTPDILGYTFDSHRRLEKEIELKGLNKSIMLIII